MNDTDEDKGKVLRLDDGDPEYVDPLGVRGIFKPGEAGEAGEAPGRRASGKPECDKAQPGPKK